jgi:hypothetical protein
MLLQPAAALGDPRPNLTWRTVSLEEEVEARLQDLLRAPVRMAVRERCPGRLELLQEPLRHGDVEPAQLGRERLRAVALRGRSRSGLGWAAARR